MHSNNDSVTLLQTQAMNIALQTLCLAIVERSGMREEIITTFRERKENLLTGILNHDEMRDEVCEQLEAAFSRLEGLLC